MTRSAARAEPSVDALSTMTRMVGRSLVGEGMRADPGRYRAPLKLTMPTVTQRMGREAIRRCLPSGWRALGSSERR